MGLLRRFGVFLLLIIILIGVSGCMKDELPQQPTKEENIAKEAEMLAYLKDKYKQEFTSIEYIPAKRGFNDGYNENVLIAESNNGIQVNAYEKLVYEGRYSDDYLNSFTSHNLGKQINYYGIKNLQGAKTYVTLLADYRDLHVLSEEFTLTKEKINSWYSIISISGEADDEVLKQLYGRYEANNSLDYGANVFIVAFGGEKSKADLYVNNYLLYGKDSWENFDESVKKILIITEKGLSLEQFKNQLVVIGEWKNAI